jgi:hypothetical protein
MESEREGKIMDNAGYIIPVVLVIVVALLIRSARIRRKKLEAMSTEERDAFITRERNESNARARAAQARRDGTTYGPLNNVMVCPHCNTRGNIRTKGITSKKGVSGGKATAALLTGGVSLLAVGLSRKEKSTQAFCSNCRNTWAF